MDSIRININSLPAQSVKFIFVFGERRRLDFIPTSEVPSFSIMMAVSVDTSNSPVPLLPRLQIDIISFTNMIE